MKAIVFCLLVLASVIASAGSESESARLGALVLLQPDSELIDRVPDTKAFSSFVRDLVRSVSLSIQGQTKRTPESGWITVGIKPPNSTKFWIHFSSLESDKTLIRKIESKLTAVPPPVLKGNIAFSMYLNLFGDKTAPPTDPKLKGALPIEWHGKRGQIPDEIFKQVWP